MYIDETVVEETLLMLLSGECDVEDTALESCRVRTFEDAGVLTYNRGVVIRLPDGSEFQVTIIQSR